jgi:hypothetical protein
MSTFERARKKSQTQTILFGTPQTKILSILAIASLALSFAVGLKTTSFGAAFLGFALGALVLMLILYDISCVALGGCDTWSVIKAILVGLALVGAILMQIAALSAPAAAPQPMPMQFAQPAY